MDIRFVQKLLHAMVPKELVLVEGCLLWPEGDPPGAEPVRESIDRYLQLPQCDERKAVRYVEQEFNQRFVIAELEHCVGGPLEWTPETLFGVAQTWSRLLQVTLPALSQGREVRVDIVGADDPTDEALLDEPLELCVTFWSEQTGRE